MKKLCIIALMSMLCFQVANAQTHHIYVTGTATNGESVCGLILNGEYTYKVSYKIDKNGYFSNLHWNIVSSSVVDQYGNKLKIIDSGHDNVGALWEFFNRLNEYNAVYGFTYSPEDGFLPLGSEFPDEGIMVNTVKLVGKKTNATMRFFTRLKLDRNGELKAYIDEFDVTCK